MSLKSEVMNTTSPQYTGFYLLSRAGFESEVANEAKDLCAQAQIGGYVQTTPNSGYAVFRTFESLARLPNELSLSNWIFARQYVPMLGECTNLPTDDRLASIFELLGTQTVSDIIAETPDTNDGKEFSGLARSLTNAARQALKKLGQYKESDKRLPRLHLLILSGTHILVGLAYRTQSSPHAGGIMHLKLPKDAPSRAILKLEEAAISLLTVAEREHWLRSGMSAVDLGAAPGGWTWWLAQQGLLITAIDNANMSESVMKTGQVEHIRADGFSWHPRHPVHWLCCDMVEQPDRVATLVAKWLKEGWAEAALFNLKLPMKKRYGMIQECMATLNNLRDTHVLRAHQLYHDREEITVLALPIAK
jgi:23S rRNA (cytidine2498-2'-O)-methyltransferase